MMQCHIAPLLLRSGVATAVLDSPSGTACTAPPCHKACAAAEPSADLLSHALAPAAFHRNRQQGLVVAGRAWVWACCGSTSHACRKRRDRSKRTQLCTSLIIRTCTLIMKSRFPVLKHQEQQGPVVHMCNENPLVGLRGVAGQRSIMAQDVRHILAIARVNSHFSWPSTGSLTGWAT